MVEDTLGWDQAWAIWHELHKPIAERLIELRKIENPTLASFQHDLTGKMCWAYGIKCTYEVQCKLATEKNLMGDATKESDLWKDMFGEEPETETVAEPEPETEVD